MRYIFLILIVIMAFSAAWAGECPSDMPLVVTSPLSGSKTMNHVVAVRGFLCNDAQVVVVKNVNTSKSTMTATDQICDRDHCIYTFSTYVDDLEMGTNELTASIPGDTPLEVRFDVIRTALALLDD